MSRLRAATVGGDPDAEAHLATLLERSSDIDLYFRCVERMELLASVRSKAVDVVVVVGVPQWFDTSLRDEFSRNRVPVVGYPKDPLEAIVLEDVGAAILDDPADLEELTEKCRTTQPPGDTIPRHEESEPSGKVIAVWGSKGAPGRTTMAIELAYALSAADPSTLLIDGDPYGGDISQFLGVEPGPGVLWASQAMIDDQSGAVQVERSLARVGPRGPVLLPGLPRPSLWRDLSLRGWQKVIAWSAASFSHSVIDTGQALGAGSSETQASRASFVDVALTSADIVLCVVRADPIGVRNFLCEYPVLEELIEPDRIRVVLNRSDAKDSRSIKGLFRKVTGRQPFAEFPEVTGLVRRSVEQGRSLAEMAPECDFAARMRDVAASLGAEVKPRSVFAKLVRR